MIGEQEGGVIEHSIEGSDVVKNGEYGGGARIKRVRRFLRTGVGSAGDGAEEEGRHSIARIRHKKNVSLAIAIALQPLMRRYYSIAITLCFLHNHHYCSRMPSQPPVSQDYSARLRCRSVGPRMYILLGRRDRKRRCGERGGRQVEGSRQEDVRSRVQRVDGDRADRRCRRVGPRWKESRNIFRG